MKYAIIGAGIGGLTTALAFEKKGIDYQLFEKAEELKPVGAGIWLAPNALQVLESLEILKEIQEAGNSIDRITLGTPQIEPLSDTDQSFVKSKFGYSTVAIHRAELQRILLDKLPKEKINLGKSFKSYSELDENQIQICFEDGTEIKSNYLIAADGINSKVRKKLFPESKTRYSGQTCWRGVVDFEMPEDFLHRGMELWEKGIRFGISPINKTKVYWFALDLSEPNQKDEENIKTLLLSKFKRFHPLVIKLLEKTKEENIIRSDINDLSPMDNWFKNNICLIGDAGHATTPNMGQGGAQAIEDAFFLSNSIAHKDGDFLSFQKARQKKVNQIVKQSWITGKMAHWQKGTRLRNFILRKTPSSILKKKMLELYSL